MTCACNGRGNLWDTLRALALMTGATAYGYGIGHLNGRTAQMQVELSELRAKNAKIEERLNTPPMPPPSPPPASNNIWSRPRSLDSEINGEFWKELLKEIEKTRKKPVKEV